jgi:hypothetical protein
MALFALSGIAELALREDELHLDLAPAIAEKLLGNDPDPCIFAQNLGHKLTPSFLVGFPTNLWNTKEKSSPRPLGERAGTCAGVRFPASWGAE